MSKEELIEKKVGVEITVHDCEIKPPGKMCAVIIVKHPPLRKRKQCIPLT